MCLCARLTATPAVLAYQPIIDMQEQNKAHFSILFPFPKKTPTRGYQSSELVHLFPMVANQNVAKSKLDRRTHCCVLAICAIRRLLGKGDNRVEGRGIQ